MSGSFTDEQIRRYSRQIILPEVGGKGQKKLLASRVLVLGAGGLGSSAIAYLAAAGVGTLGIVDDDLVEMSNLQRQIIHGGNIGLSKAKSAETFVRSLNSDVDVVTYQERFSAENAGRIVREYDFVVDGSDNFATHYLINDVCVLEKKPCSHGSILRYEGYTTTTIPQKGPCYRCIFKKTPPPGLIPSCQEAGVFGVLPGIIGTIQASEALKYILGIGELLAGRLLCFNALDMSFFEAGADKRMDCAVCGEQPLITKIEQKNYLENRQKECGL
ncbi:MAG: molybdopterin-synthase adenylyltransferase MoeB [Methanothrix sp.]|nr:molybdopterin-synthase adenylyltransferase MoeB [Methanothrix sp.]